MGCAKSVVNNSFDFDSKIREEKIVSNLEKNLSFSYKSCREMVNTFRLASTGGCLNSLQLARALNDLSWTSYAKSKTSPLNIVLSRISKDSKIPLIKLCFLSILLGKSLIEAKAELIFRLFDPEALGILDEEKIILMLNLLIEISAEVIPWIALENNILTAAEIQEYIRTLKKKEKNFVKKIKNEIIGQKSAIKPEDFVNSIKNIRFLRDITVARGVRSMLVDESIENDEEESKIETLVITPTKALSINIVSIEDENSPTLDYTSSDDDSPIFQNFSEKKNVKTPEKIVKNTKKPPRPTKSTSNSRNQSPESGLSNGFLSISNNLIRQNSDDPTKKKFRCKSVSGNNAESCTVKYNLSGKSVEIELKQWEDPIRVAHNFAVKNKLNKKERNKIALKLMKVQKSMD